VSCKNNSTKLWEISLAFYQFIQWYSFNKNFLSAFCIQGTILSSDNITLNNNKIMLYLQKADVLLGDGRQAS
jgi:hypothetical protein